jgi:hypothetical protein
VLLAICALAYTAGFAGWAGGASFTGTATAAQRVKLAVHLSPKRLGKGTTIEFSIQISAPGQLVPSPLSGLALRYPARMGLATSGLGRATCTATMLEDRGKAGCPANALMGFGSALLAIPAEGEIVHEPGSISIWMAPVANNDFQLLFYANATAPASEPLVFAGLIEEADAPFGGSLNTQIPPIPWSPESPPASITRFTARIGSQNVTYYRRAGRHEIPYRPEGLRLPHSCPRGGFPFAVTLAFVDGTRTTARAFVPCPGRAARAPSADRRRDAKAR